MRAAWYNTDGFFFSVCDMKLSEIKEHLDAWQAADLAITRGKSYTVDGLTYTRQDAAAVREQLQYWQRRYAALLRRGRGGATFRPVVSLDHWKVTR